MELVALWILGAVVLSIVYLCDKEVLKFDSAIFFQFLKVLLLGSAIAIVVNTILGRFPLLPDLGSGTILLVGWEDLFFSAALIYYPKKYLPPFIAIPLAVMSSVLFAFGHLYQGILWAAITLIYPYFISYKLAKKHGYGTVIAIHTAYDLCIYGTIVVLNYVKTM